jgi:chemotaxis protein methyltransferase CheR
VLLPEPWSDEDFRPVAGHLQARRSGPLSPQRLALLQARLRARLQSRGVPSFTWFLDRELSNRPDGAGMQLLIDLSTVNHTSFFREEAGLGSLAERLVEPLRRARAVPLRVWTAGCSAGQEPYSLAMLLAERVPGLGPDHLELWASDMSMEVVHAAARAIYDDRELVDVSPDRLRRFFLRGRGPRHGSYRIAPEVRRLVTFLHFDLHAKDWPIPGEFDAILCRNVAIYFSEAERTTLLDRLAGRLRPGGWLLVGHCEILPERPGLLRKQGPSLFRRVP